MIARPSIRIPVSQISVSGTSDEPVRKYVSVAAPPPRLGALDRDDRTATAPRVGAIRAQREWSDDRVLRHADKRKDRG